MRTNAIKPRKALNKAFLKVKPARKDIEVFKTQLIQLLDRINEAESEEFHKNLIIEFLRRSYFADRHFINTKGRNDLVIHNGPKADSSVGVIIETKKPTNRAEMISADNINRKAFHELVLYYLRERITHKNLEVRHLVVSNINEWYIFDAMSFDRLFAQNKFLVKQFQDFEAGRLADTRTDFFYRQIAEPFIAEQVKEIEYTYFNIQDYQTPLRNADKSDDRKLIALYKLLSPEHLLKLPFANDSNSLDKRFYGELLHIIGLTETKSGGKKLIERPEAEKRHSGCILENAINELDSLDKISRVKRPAQYGANYNERLFNVALELSITWINRILFLKLLEAQLMSYHRGDKSQRFLDFEKINNYDDLNSLFFKVLARKHDERQDDVARAFERVPYLNSSLFEPTELEHDALFISNLRDEKTIPILSTTVLRDEQGRRLTGEMSTLQYLFAFLDAYDFSSEGSEEIQEENKTLINASVLGLIFEKINGYKDGSFFTPGFITMYMCRETIRRAVTQKFRETYGWKLDAFEDIRNYIADRRSATDIREFNTLVNAIKICDPAVGSGHFLVSSLNEVILIKYELGILTDRSGQRITDYELAIENDELIVTDHSGKLFEYQVSDQGEALSRRAQILQEALFHEKQSIIESCLFGVDINPNSVKICRLRLWIELLKHAYYKGAGVLETLPNIDINIKCGNSLVSRFALDADLRQALKKSKWNIDAYRIAVATYRNAGNKEEKREMEHLIADIKSDFRSEITQSDPKMQRLRKLSGELFNLTNQGVLFELSDKEKAAQDKKILQLSTDIEKLEADIEEIKSNKIYENAFEWRFEFPEVLNEEGDFMGFDVVIGNPPYIQLQAIKDISEQLKKFDYKTYEKTGDIYSLFYEKGHDILKCKGYLGFITSNKWMRSGYGKSTRNYFLEHTQPLLIIDLGSGIFDEASVDSNILFFKKSKYDEKFNALDLSKEKDVGDIYSFYSNMINITPKIDESWTITSQLVQSIKLKIEQQGKPLKEWDISINYGIKTGFNEAFIIDNNKRNELIALDPKNANIIKPILRGRDIKRYKASFADLWLINVHNGVKSLNIPRINVEEDYPTIYNHLLEYEAKLSKRSDKGDHWTNLRNCAYLKEFEKEKIIFQEMVQFSSFLFDKHDNFFCLDTGRIITGKNLKFLISILNSKLFFFAIKSFYGGGGLGESGVRMKHSFYENFVLRELAENEQLKYIELVDAIISQKEVDEDTSDLESQIDRLVYELYGLTEEEIEIVEKGVG
jgi:adenine-specific DNA-methyltransferase